MCFNVTTVNSRARTLVSLSQCLRSTVLLQQGPFCSNTKKAHACSAVLFLYSQTHLSFLSLCDSKAFSWFIFLAMGVTTKAFLLMGLIAFLGMQLHSAVAGQFISGFLLFAQIIEKVSFFFYMFCVVIFSSINI